VAQSTNQGCSPVQQVQMSVKSWRARTRRDLIIEVWEALDCESVGVRELEQIQQELGEKFGAGALESPASIARVVADEGAVLRHPEVFACDLKWRERQPTNQGLQTQLDFSDVTQAFQAVVTLEERRLELKDNADEKGQTQLRDIVASVRKDLLLRARSQIIDKHQREQAKEISEWLRVWLQAPELFSDWLDLRRRSPEFRKKFPE
jgi:hypothetical protein